MNFDWIILLWGVRVTCRVWTHKWTQEAQELKYKIECISQKQESEPNKVKKNTRAGNGCGGWALLEQQNNNLEKKLETPGRCKTKYKQKIISNARKAEQSTEQKISSSTNNYGITVAKKKVTGAELRHLDENKVETGNWKLSGRGKRPKFNLWGTTHSGSEQIRICLRYRNWWGNSCR